MNGESGSGFAGREKMLASITLIIGIAICVGTLVAAILGVDLFGPIGG